MLECSGSVCTLFVGISRGEPGLSTLSGMRKREQAPALQTLARNPQSLGSWGAMSASSRGGYR